MGIEKVEKKVTEKAAGGIVNTVTKAADSVANTGIKIADSFRKGKDAKVDRELKVKTQQFNDITGYINTGINALKDICDAYNKIMDSLDKKKRTEVWIQEQKVKMENERRRIDNEAIKIQNEFNKDMQKIDNEHDEKMAEIERKKQNDYYMHEARIKVIDKVFDLANQTMQLLQNNQFDPTLTATSMQQIQSAMNQLPKLTYNPED